jgi:hypothetical protein
MRAQTPLLHLLTHPSTHRPRQIPWLRDHPRKLDTVFATRTLLFPGSPSILPDAMLSTPSLKQQTPTDSEKQRSLPPRSVKHLHKSKP